MTLFTDFAIVFLFFFFFFCSLPLARVRAKSHVRHGNVHVLAKCRVRKILNLSRTFVAKLVSNSFPFAFDSIGDCPEHGKLEHRLQKKLPSSCRMPDSSSAAGVRPVPNGSLRHPVSKQMALLS
jgi:hypothetical protein